MCFLHLALHSHSLKHLFPPEQTPFFYTAMQQGVVPQNTFAFKLAQSGSELTIGGTNSDSFTGDIEYHTLSSTIGYWVIGGGSVTVNGEAPSSVGQIQTIIDSGSTLITAPTAAADAFWQTVEGASQFEEGLYTFPCDSVPEVAFSWGGQSWPLSADRSVIPLVGVQRRQVLMQLVA